MNTQDDKKGLKVEETRKGLKHRKVTKLNVAILGFIAIAAIGAIWFAVGGKKDKIDLAAVAEGKDYTVTLKQNGKDKYAEIVGDNLNLQNVADIAGAIEENEKTGYVVYSFTKAPEKFTPNGEYVKGMKFKADFTKEEKKVSEYSLLPGTKADIDTYREWKVETPKISGETMTVKANLKEKAEAGKALSQGKGFIESIRQLNPKKKAEKLIVKMNDKDKDFIYNEAHKDVIEAITVFAK